MTKLYEKFSEIITEVASIALEREDVVRGIMLAILARRNVFFLGPPGTAKSMSVNETKKRIVGATGFDLLFTRFTEPGEVFGALDVAALGQGVQRRNCSGMLPEANIGFLDEAFKANSAILNAMLGILNEHTYRNGPVMLNTPMWSSVVASNETPQGEDLGALYDRFLLRFFVPSLGDDANVAKMLTAPRTLPAPTATVTVKDVAKAHDEVDNVTVTPETVAAYIGLRTVLARNGLHPSDRRFKHAISVMQANAFMAGRDHTLTDDIEVCASIFWNAPEERAKVRGYVLDVAMPGLKAAVEILDSATEQFGLLKLATDEGARLEAAKKLRVLADKITKDAKGGAARVVAMAAKVRALQQAGAKLVMGE